MHNIFNHHSTNGLSKRHSKALINPSKSVVGAFDRNLPGMEELLAKQNAEPDDVIQLAEGLGKVIVCHKYNYTLCNKTHVNIFLLEGLSSGIKPGEKVEVFYDSKTGLIITNQNALAGKRKKGASYVTPRAHSGGYVKIESDGYWAQDLIRDMNFAKLNASHPQVSPTMNGVTITIRQHDVQTSLQVNDQFPIAIKPSFEQGRGKRLRITALDSYMRQLGFRAGSSVDLVFGDGFIDFRHASNKSTGRLVTISAYDGQPGTVLLRKAINGVSFIPMGLVSKDRVKPLEDGGFRICANKERKPINEKPSLFKRRVSQSTPQIELGLNDASVSNGPANDKPVDEVSLVSLEENNVPTAIESMIADAQEKNPVKDDLVSEQNAKVADEPKDNPVKRDLNYNNTIEHGNIKFSITLTNGTVEDYKRIREIEDAILNLSQG